MNSLVKNKTAAGEAMNLSASSGTVINSIAPIKTIKMVQVILSAKIPYISVGIKLLCRNIYI